MTTRRPKPSDLPGGAELGRHSAPLSLLVRPVLLALGVVALLFLAYEVAEHLLLSPLDHDVLHVLHRIRGLGAALVAAVLVGWFLLRRSHPLLATALTTDQWVDGMRPSASERNALYARWFILMRWVAVLVAGVMIFATVWGAGLLPRAVGWPLVGGVVVLGGLNGVYTALLRRGRSGPSFLALQAYADLLILTALLHFSGGVENPLAPLMLFHVIIAGIVLSRRQCFAVAAAGSLLFALLAWVELTGLLPHYTLDVFPHVEHVEAGDHAAHVTHAAHNALYAVSMVVLQGAVLFLTAFFVTTLADRLRHDERQLERFAERALRERQLLERALETTRTGLCVCDRDLQPLWNNRQWEAWFGRAPADSPVCQQVHGPQSPARETLQDGAVRVSEVALACPDGCSPGCSNPSSGPGEATRTFQVSTAPLLGPEGEVGHIVQLVQDVTEQKHTQAHMMRAGQLAAVGELAGQVAHEVNNPIAIISAKTRLLLANQHGELSEKTAQELAKIRDLSDRVARIAQGLLSYCRPAAGTRTRLDVREPVRKALCLVEPRATLAGIEIADFLPECPLPVRANAAEMEQVFLNLLLNGIDAMPSGGRLTVGAEAREPGDGGASQAAITVEDTGVGMARSVQDRVFEPFFTTKAEGEGTGLGLSICLGLIRSHGGRIALDSEPGRGTRVVVRLPHDGEPVIDGTEAGTDEHG